MEIWRHYDMIPNTQVEGGYAKELGSQEITTYDIRHSTYYALLTVGLQHGSRHENE